MYKILYGLDKKGGYKQWEIWTVEDTLYIRYGKEGGVLQERSEKISGKNVGRSNETTPEMQALFELNSRYKKQLDKGYRENKQELKEELPLLPMLASDYRKHGHRIQYPCYVSAKLDGLRCLAIKDSDRVRLVSRGGKEYNVPHIQEQLSKCMPDNAVWDGELYIHGKHLEEITSAVKKENELTPKIEYRIFDVVTEHPFKLRVNYLSCLALLPSLKIVSSIVVQNEEEMKNHHKILVDMGYEGVMLRNFDGMYESGKRSADLQKYKEFLDHEFRIVDVLTDKDGGAIFVVQNAFAENTFDVVGGSMEQRQEWAKSKESVIGKWITVKYQKLYKGSLKPQFPTLVGFREEGEF